MNWNIFHREKEIVVDLSTIESDIKYLVEAMMGHYRISMSREGVIHCHYGSPYPWVDLEANQDFVNLMAHLAQYNVANKPTWTLQESHFDTRKKEMMYRLMPECKVFNELSEYQKMTLGTKILEHIESINDDCGSLEILQKSANDLARYLKESWE